MPSSTTTAVQIPGYRAGTWQIDPVHSEIGFSIRHMMVSKVRGRFMDFDATIRTAEDPFDSTVEAHVRVASVSTREEHRDAHLRTSDFFEAEKYPTIDFVSTRAYEQDGDFKVDGNLTIKDVTKLVTLDFDFGGFAKAPSGEYRAGATARTVIDREDFGLKYNAALETGGVLVGNTVTITLELEAILQD